MALSYNNTGFLLVYSLKSFSLCFNSKKLQESQRPQRQNRFSRSASDCKNKIFARDTEDSITLGERCSDGFIFFLFHFCDVLYSGDSHLVRSALKAGKLVAPQACRLSAQNFSGCLMALNVQNC